LCQTIFAGIVGFALMACAQALGDQSAFNDAWSEKIKQVAATSDHADDIDLAKEMLTVVKEASDVTDVSMKVLIYNKAFELASPRPGGYLTAWEAMAALADQVPDQRVVAHEKIAAILIKQMPRTRGAQKQYVSETLAQTLILLSDAKVKAGDYADAIPLLNRARSAVVKYRTPLIDLIKEKMTVVSHRNRVARQVDRLKKEVLDNPTPDALQRLVKMYLIELDSPSLANDYLAGVQDESLLQHVPQAAIAGADADEKMCRQLGKWYESLANQASRVARLDMLKRAHGFYETFLEKHQDNGIERLQVTTRLSRIEKELSVNVAGLVVKGNVALGSRGATVSGTSARGNRSTQGKLMIDGNKTEYDSHAGFSNAYWPCVWDVTLAKTFKLSEVRVLLWDGDSRSYPYILEVSADGKKFDVVVDRSKGEPKSWQRVRFSPRPVRVIRLRGISNSRNSGYHVVEIEAYCLTPRS
jgi:hypothetical protein